MQAFQLHHLHRNRNGNRGDDRSEWAAAWLPHLRLGWAMEAATEWAKGDVLFRNVEHVLSELEGVDSDDAKAVWKNLGNTSHPRDNTEPIFADHYAEMGPENAVRYLMSSYWSFHRSGNEARNFLFEQFVEIAEATDFVISHDLENSLLGNINRWVPRNVKPSQRFFDALIASHLKRRGGEENFDWSNIGRIHQYFRGSGHGEAAEQLTKRVLDSAAKKPLPERITAIETFLSYSEFPSERDGTIAPGGRYHVMVNHLAPLYEKLPREQYFSRGVREKLDDFLQHGINDHFNADEVELDDAATQARETLVEMRGHLAQRLADGAAFWGHDHAELDIPRNHMVSAARRGLWLEAAAMASHPADRASIFDSWGQSFGRIVNPSIERLMEADGPEIAFALIRRIEGDYRLPEQQAQLLSIAKAQAAREIPNLISVPKSDPTYDIHLASHQLTLGNETRAWALTRPKLDRLRESWQQFDPAYVAWVIDQMRKQKQLDAAMDFAMNVLMEEQSLNAAVAARVSLAKADIFRDMENYQAARVEYESLTASDRYTSTAAGEEARYRLIELLIITRDYGSAEQMLARIEDSPDPREQAEAYYYYARIAYEQEDYKQAADYLKQVRDRVMSHVEAAFLEGELALVLPGGLQQTEVQVGNPELATVAIPGRELTLKLQDPNLSIARGNASIPVVVQTTRGGDVENIELMPSATAQNTFSGTIPTALGTPEKDNLRLELRGDDQVTYNIAPEFQKANDLDYAPKVLEVKADARLVASSGEILSVDEQEQRELQRQVAANRSDNGRHWAYQNDRVVRPGNPIHVQVSDADRDLGPDRQTVTVDVETSSGDRIRGFELTETGPHDAVFRGSIPTGLPLPTARASDSFEGSHPADAINSRRNGVWSSLPDGNAPKWIEVDTMSSHEVRAASIQSPDLDRVLQVRLLGSLGGEFEELAAWPVGREERGLTVEYFKDKDFENKIFERTDPSLGFEFRGDAPNGHMPQDNFSARWTGRIVPDEAGEYTFHLDADDKAELWIEGESVAKVTNHNKPAKGSVKLEAKPHKIRIEMVEGSGTARMRLQWEGPSIERQNIANRYLLPDNASEASRRDGLRVHADNAQTGTGLRQIRQHLMRSNGITYYQKDTTLDRKDTPYYHGDFWYVARMTGAFYVPESRVLELKMTQGKSRRNQQHAYILIDGDQIFGGKVEDRDREQTFRVPLSQGMHELEVVTADLGRNGRVELSYRTDEGTFEPLPAKWFSVDAHPELAKHVMPKAKISFEGDRIVANMNEPERLRTLRWVFESFSGNQISVSQMRVLDTERNRVIPVDRDFREGLNNDTLEIAPGDEITVTYNDLKRLDTDAPTLASSLNARYYDGSIRIVNEVITTNNGRRTIEYNPARRFSVGDQLAILVEEYDADLTSDADTLEVVAESSSGGRVTLQALEQRRQHQRGDAVHSGRFLGVL
ncbi:MAG: PA14 domain-containing protein, partial [Phycisphaeraceae bacterium]